jgi:hypothetical protein
MRLRCRASSFFFLKRTLRYSWIQEIQAGVFQKWSFTQICCSEPVHVGFEQNPPWEKKSRAAETSELSLTLGPTTGRRPHTSVLSSAPHQATTRYACFIFSRSLAAPRSEASMEVVGGVSLRPPSAPAPARIGQLSSVDVGGRFVLRAAPRRYPARRALAVEARGGRSWSERQMLQQRRGPQLPKVEDDGNPRFVIFIRTANVRD